MILFENRNRKIFKYFKRLKNTDKKVVILIILIAIAIPVYYYVLTSPKLSPEDQLKDYSKYVVAPQMSIDIKFKNYQKLLYERDKALKAGGNSPWNMSVKFTEVPAKITYNGVEYRADISLKGSRKDHYADSTRMSFQVDLKDDKTIMGMRKFSLHDPKMRNYIYEWMFHELLRREGFIALKYDFIQVKINGNDAGVYAIEERPDKILLERYGYVEGPIFKLADDTDSSFFNTVEVFNEKRYNSPEFKAITEKAYILARGFQEGRYKLDEFVNTDMLARYFALCDAFMYFHGSLVKSIRFYYNPVTGKFEPIGFDGHCGENWPHIINSEIMQRIKDMIGYLPAVNIFQEVIFYNEKNYDREFLTAYVKYLQKYSSFKYLGDFYSETSAEITEKMAILYKNQPLLEDGFNSFGPKEFKFSKKHILNRAQYIRKLLAYDNFLSRTRISLKIEDKSKGKNEFDLEISNNFSFPLELVEVEINDSITFTPYENDLVISEKYGHKRNYKKIRFRGKTLLPDKIYSSKLIFRICGTEKLLSEDIEFYSDKLPVVMNDDIIRKDTDIKGYSKYILIDEVNKQIRFREGKIKINQVIKIPKGYKVYIEVGTEISLCDSASILSFSPIYINGAKDKPVMINSDGTGGIAVYNCDSASVISNAVFSGLSNPRSEEWKLTGSLTFYKSPAAIENCEFRDNRSEDYLNIKQSSFKISGCRFINVSSDAFDSDFSNGEINNTVFNFTGNDAVDVSGSEVNCMNVNVKGSKDKAFSSGEGSVLKVSKSEISDTEICFAAKDNSKIECSDIKIERCKLGFAAYQKKSEYGPGSIVADNIKINVIKKEMLIEINSFLKLNGKEIKGEEEDVKDEHLYGKEFGSPSIR